jgi:hypothetical protein
MPPLPPIPSTIRIKLGGSYGTSGWMNTFYARYTGGPPTLADLTTMAGLMGAQWGGSLGQHLDATLKLETITIDDMAAVDGVGYATTSTNVGFITSVIKQPASVAVAVSWKVARRFRGGHGRTYLCGIPGQGLLDQTHITDTYKAGYIADAGNWLSWINARVYSSMPTLKMVMVRRYSGKHFDATHGKWVLNVLDPPLFDYVTGVNVNTRIDTQRRRLG